MKINKYILQQRQQYWKSNDHNKLQEIKLTLEEWKQSNGKKIKRGSYIDFIFIQGPHIPTWSKAANNMSCMAD